MDVSTREMAVLLSGFSVALLIAMAGCESDSNGMTITPSSLTLRPGESADFEASGGGSEYEWTLAEESWGSLSSRTGSKVTYTSRYSGTQFPVVQTLTVVSWVPGDSRSASDPESALKGVSAQADITQLQVLPDVFPNVALTPSSSTTTTTTTTTSTTTTTASGPPTPP